MLNSDTFVYEWVLSSRLDDRSFENPVGLKKLRSLILLTYYDDDNPVQTCEEKLLLSTLKGSTFASFLVKEARFVAKKLPICCEKRCSLLPNEQNFAQDCETDILDWTATV